MLGAWRLLWEADLMETLAPRARQPVSGGLFIEGGEVVMECQPGAGDHRPGLSPSQSPDAGHEGNRLPVTLPSDSLGAHGQGGRREVEGDDVLWGGKSQGRVFLGVY